MKIPLTFAIAFLILLLTTPSLAQDNQEKQTATDRWAGMVINVSTPDDAIRLFGPPSKDKDKVALDFARPVSWLSAKIKEKVFRTLFYERARWQDPDELQRSYFLPIKDK